MANFDISNMTDDEIMKSSDFIKSLTDIGITAEDVSDAWMKQYLSSYKTQMKYEKERQEKLLKELKKKQISNLKRTNEYIKALIDNTYKLDKEFKDKEHNKKVLSDIVPDQTALLDVFDYMSNTESYDEYYNKTLNTIKRNEKVRQRRKINTAFYREARTAAKIRERRRQEILQAEYNELFGIGGRLDQKEKLKSKRQAAIKDWHAAGSPHRERYTAIDNAKEHYNNLSQQVYDREAVEEENRQYANRQMDELFGNSRFKGKRKWTPEERAANLARLKQNKAEAPTLADSAKNSIGLMAGIAIITGLFKKLANNLKQFDNSIYSATKTLSDLSALDTTEYAAALRAATEESNKLALAYQRSKLSSEGLWSALVNIKNDQLSDIVGPGYANFVYNTLEATGKAQLTQQGTATQKITDQVTFALAEAFKVVQDKYKELNRNQILSLPEFQDWFNYFLNPNDKGMGGYTTSGWEGYMYSLGRYIPGANYSQGDIRKMQQEYIEAVGNNPDLIAQYTEQTRLLKTIGQNLYDFDEVISNSNVFIPDSDIVANLTGDDISSMMAEQAQIGVDATRDEASKIEEKLGNIVDAIGSDGPSISDLLDQENKNSAGAWGALDQIRDFLLNPEKYVTTPEDTQHPGSNGGAHDLFSNVTEGEDAAHRSDNISDDTTTSNTSNTLADFIKKHGPGKLTGSYPNWQFIPDTGFAYNLTTDSQGNVLSYEIIKDKEEITTPKSTGIYYPENFPSHLIEGGQFAHADGGIGTVESHNNTLFEGNRPEAIIPLTSSRGIDFMANAIRKANESAGNIGGVSVNLELSGINIADNDRQWNEVALKLGERLALLNRKAGNYFG